MFLEHLKAMHPGLGIVGSDDPVWKELLSEAALKAYVKS